MLVALAQFQFALGSCDARRDTTFTAWRRDVTTIYRRAALFLV
jgi:hypothetical protein